MIDDVKYFFCRVVEARMLLFNIAYEKAKLQLMQMKHERLLVFLFTFYYSAMLAVGDTNVHCSQKKVQQLSFGLQESQMMKLNFIPSSDKSGAIDTQDSDSNIHTSLLNSKGKCQVFLCVCGKLLFKLTL